MNHALMNGLMLVAVGGPLLSMLFIGLGLQRFPDRAGPISSALAAVPVVALVIAAIVWDGDATVVDMVWIHTGAVRLTCGYAVTGLTILMAILVVVMHTLIQIFSIAYMEGEQGRPRYFAYLHLFCFAMLLLVLAPDLIQTYIGWELVGLASFLLIGFYHERSSARRAARKAFLLNRVGDVGFLIGLALLLIEKGRLAIDPTNATQLDGQLHTVVALLLFMGIAGKSAQFPLHVWLADAMEGPTPVSALLHSATMVAAGVFLMARLQPFFGASETASSVILLIATVTMLMASCMAIVQRDFKRILAYSTVSQLGFMLMALAIGATFAGVFHLLTHAAFKALLFLVSGIYIHHFHVQNIDSMRGARRLGLAFWGLVIGCAALSGVPFVTSGYWSKEAILGALWDQEMYPYFALAVLGVFLTAYYSFRLVFILARSETQNDPSPDDTDVSIPVTMAVPVAVLAVAAVVLGYTSLIGGEGAHDGGMLSAFTHIYPDHFQWMSVPAGIAIGAMTLGVLASWLDFGRSDDAVGVLDGTGLGTLFLRRFFLDDFWRWAEVKLMQFVGQVASSVDREVIDGGSDAFARDLVRAGGGLSRFHHGQVRRYVAMVVIGMVVLALWAGSML